MSAVLATALATKALKKDGPSQPAPKTLKQSIFQKPLTWVVIAGVAIYFGYKLVKKLGGNKTISETKQDIAELQKTQKQTFLDSQYAAYAGVLFIAMDGLGTDENAVYRVFTAMKNDLDVAKLIEAFGVRKEQTLPEWIQDDLSSDEMDQVNKILASKGIKYRF